MSLYHAKWIFEDSIFLDTVIKLELIFMALITFAEFVYIVSLHFMRVVLFVFLN